MTKIKNIKSLTQNDVGKEYFFQGVLEWQKVNKSSGEISIKSWLTDQGHGKIYLPTSFNSDDLSKRIGNLDQKQLVRIKGVVGKVKNGPKEGNFLKSVSDLKAFECHEGDNVIPELLKDKLNEKSKLIKHSGLRAIVVKCLKETGTQFLLAPYSRDCFDYKGGLADYTFRLIDALEKMTKRPTHDYFLGDMIGYDTDLLFTAAFMHRIGKIKKYFFDDENRICVNEANALNDELTTTLEIYYQYLPKGKLDDETKARLTHLIESSKGRRHGGLIEPMTKEAKLLYALESLILTQAVFDKYYQTGVESSLYEGGIVRGPYYKDWYIGNLTFSDIEEPEEVEEVPVKEEEKEQPNEEKTNDQ